MRQKKCKDNLARGAIIVLFVVAILLFSYGINMAYKLSEMQPVYEIQSHTQRIDLECFTSRIINYTDCSMTDFSMMKLQSTQPPKILCEDKVYLSIYEWYGEECSYSIRLYSLTNKSQTCIMEYFTKECVKNCD